MCDNSGWDTEAKGCVYGEWERREGAVKGVFEFLCEFNKGEAFN